MADELLDEHEQSEKVRKWLKENSLPMLAGIVVAFGGLFGWEQWKYYQVNHAIEAQVKFSALDVDQLSDAELTAQVSVLQKEFSDTPYASMATLSLAKKHYNSGDAESAVGYYDWAQKHLKLSELDPVLRIRKARMVLAEGDAEKALQIIDGNNQSYESMAAEVRGDALRKLDRDDDARTAYKEAMDALQTGAGNRAYLEMKLFDVGGEV